MAFVDPISDMITRIRNAQMRLLSNVTIPSSKFRKKIIYVAEFSLPNMSAYAVHVLKMCDAFLEFSLISLSDTLTLSSNNCF